MSPEDEPNLNQELLNPPLLYLDHIVWHLTVYGLGISCGITLKDMLHIKFCNFLDEWIPPPPPPPPPKCTHTQTPPANHPTPKEKNSQPKFSQKCLNNYTYFQKMEMIKISKQSNILNWKSCISQQQTLDTYLNLNKYSLLMQCIKIKSPVKFLLNEQYVFVGGNISFLCVLSCSSEEA